MCTNIVLSSDKKVYNISEIERPVEMNWNQDRFSKGKRGFGHIYLGKLTGDRGFEAYLKEPFMTELGVHIKADLRLCCFFLFNKEPTFFFCIWSAWNMKIYSYTWETSMNEPDLALRNLI